MVPPLSLRGAYDTLKAPSTLRFPFRILHEILVPEPGHTWVIVDFLPLRRSNTSTTFIQATDLSLNHFRRSQVVGIEELNQLPLALSVCSVQGPKCPAFSW